MSAGIVWNNLKKTCAMCRIKARGWKLTYPNSGSSKFVQSSTCLSQVFVCAANRSAVNRLFARQAHRAKSVRCDDRTPPLARRAAKLSLQNRRPSNRTSNSANQKTVRALSVLLDLFIAFRRSGRRKWSSGLSVSAWTKETRHQRAKSADCRKVIFPVISALFASRALITFLRSDRNRQKQLSGLPSAKALC